MAKWPQPLFGRFDVLHNGVVPAQAFETVLNMAALGIIDSCAIQLYRWSKRKIPETPVVPAVGQSLDRTDSGIPAGSAGTAAA
jgi:hypothetical protein